MPAHRVTRDRGGADEWFDAEEEHTEGTEDWDWSWWAQPSREIYRFQRR